MRSASEIRRELELLLRSRTPAIRLQSWEEGRSLKLLRELGRILSPTRVLFTWSSGQGLRLEGQPVLGLPTPCTLSDALAAAGDHKGAAIFTFLDADLSTPENARCVRDLISHITGQPRTLVFLSPSFALHRTLTRLLPRVELGPPDTQELKSILSSVASRCSSLVGVEIQLDGDAPERLAEAARGLTADEAERAYMRALLEVQRLSIKEAPILLSEKRRVVEEDPLLTYILPSEQMEDLGGLEILRDWLLGRGKMFSQSATSTGLPTPRGVLLVGMTGCGRSIAVRAAAANWNLPLLQLEVASLIDTGIEGEQRLRASLHRAESLAPCVLFIPGLDQLFARGDEAEGGRVATPVAATLQRWLISKDTPVFAAVTADDHERLPLELLWKRAFDEVFFIDFPNSEERRQVLKVLLEKRGLLQKDINIEMLVAASEGFSRAQITHALIRGMGEAFDKGRAIKMIDIVQSLRLMTPMAGFMGESRRRLRSWAHRRAISASPIKEENIRTTGRNQ